MPLAQPKRMATEFLTILVGILAALGIEAWYAGVRDRALGLEYQVRIAQELRSARVFLEGIGREATRALEYSEAAASFFNTGLPSGDPDELVIAIYNMGRDNPRSFDRSTFEDIVSTGRLNLIAPIEVREAIQRAYRSLDTFETQLAPYRDEYLKVVRGWIPLHVINQIRAECSSMSAVSFTCPPVDLPEEDVRKILSGLSTDEAALAFRLRRQALPVTRAIAGEAIRAVDSALALMSTGEL